MIPKAIEVHPWSWDDFRSAVRLNMLYREDGKTFIAKEIVWEELDSYQAYHEAPVVLQWDQAQALMDRLWAQGLRPTEGTGSAGALAATEKHLDDMRKIVFDLLTVERKI